MTILLFALKMVLGVLGAGYGDGPKHETSETSETKSETQVIRNTPPYHKSPVAATAVLNDYNFCDFYKKNRNMRNSAQRI